MGGLSRDQSFHTREAHSVNMKKLDLWQKFFKLGLIAQQEATLFSPVLFSLTKLQGSETRV